MNESLTHENSIEFFIKDERYYAQKGGKVSEVTPGSDLYLTALKAAVSHEDYVKLLRKYNKGNDLVFGFIRDYLSGYNTTADIQDEILIDCDGDQVILINNHKITPREKDLIRAASMGLCDKQIAALYDISVFTVNAIFKTLRMKLDATSKYHIISMAAKAGLV